MNHRAHKDYPRHVLRQAAKFFFTHFRVFLQFALVPIFIAFLGYFSKFLFPQGNIVITVIKGALALILGAYFSVRWIRFIFLKEAPDSAIAPLNFSKRDLQYAFINLVIMLVSNAFATLIGGGIMAFLSFMGGAGMMSSMLNFLLMAVIIFFISVRLKFVFIDIALDRKLDFKKSWSGTEGIWLGMFGYLFLVLLIFGFIQMGLILLFSQMSGGMINADNALDLQYVMGLMQRHGWITDSLTYVVRAMDLSIIIPYYLYKFKK